MNPGGDRRQVFGSLLGTDEAIKDDKAAKKQDNGLHDPAGVTPAQEGAQQRPGKEIAGPEGCRFVGMDFDDALGCHRMI